jgi:hypothetical protein
VVAVAIEGHKAVETPGITRIEGWHGDFLRKIF